jgi:hypothetical protein
MGQNVECKNTEWDKTSNVKTSNGTKCRMEIWNEKICVIFFGFLLLLSDYMSTAVLHTDGQSLLVVKRRIARNVESKQCRIRRHIMFKRVKNKCSSSSRTFYCFWLDRIQ